MRIIRRYVLPLRAYLSVPLPRKARVVHVELHNGEPCLWVDLDTDAKEEQRQFSMIETGQPVPLEASYLGTFLIALRSWHLFQMEK
jgi:hypothetical protein